METHRAEARGGERVGSEVWFDVEGGDGTIVEVKSCERRMSSGRRGRFRLWLDQHRNLRDHSGEYDFIVTDDDDVVEERTLSAADVDELIDDEDLKWSLSGDAHEKHRQIKLVWTYVLDPDELGGQ